MSAASWAPSHIPRFTWAPAASKTPNVKSILNAIKPNIVLGTPSKLACSVFITEPQLKIGLMLQAGL